MLECESNQYYRLASWKFFPSKCPSSGLKYHFRCPGTALCANRRKKGGPEGWALGAECSDRTLFIIHGTPLEAL